MSEDDQISPAVIHRCDKCHVRNFAIGGRTANGVFHPVYEGEAAASEKIRPKLGSKGWCGRNGPEIWLRVIRIVCERVSTEDGELNLCQRCARETAAKVA